MERGEDRDREDRELIEAAVAGDARALDRLLLRHERRLLRLLRLLGVPPDDREDVAQEVFLRVFRHLKGFRRGRSFSGWLYRIAANAAHDQRHRLHRRHQHEAGWNPLADQAVDQGPDPAEALATDERWRRLEAMLDRLTERERAVFVLCELEGLSTREVAGTLRISAITVRRHLGRARSRLEAGLREKSSGD